LWRAAPSLRATLRCARRPVRQPAPGREIPFMRHSVSFRPTHPSFSHQILTLIDDAGRLKPPFSSLRTRPRCSRTIASCSAVDMRRWWRKCSIASSMLEKRWLCWRRRPSSRKSLVPSKTKYTSHGTGPNPGPAARGRRGGSRIVRNARPGSRLPPGDKAQLHSNGSRAEVDGLDKRAPALPKVSGRSPRGARPV